jgi:hypothetical protein
MMPPDPEELRLDPAEKQILEALAKELGVKKIFADDAFRPNQRGNLWLEHPYSAWGQYFSPEEMAMTGHVRGLMISAFKDARYTDPPEQLTEFETKSRHQLAGADAGKISRIFELIGQLPYLVALDLGRNDWAELPASFYTMPNRGTLRWLSVTHNGLTKLDARIGEFTGVRVLDLYDNQLTQLPESMGNLTKLDNLQLVRNKLSDLPRSFENLSVLNQLNISTNRFTELPSILRSLKNVHEFYAIENEIYQIPNWIGEIVELRYFFIGNNPITIIPEEILSLTHLTDLLVSPKNLHPFFLELLEVNRNEWFGKFYPPNGKEGMMGRWKNFIPTIIEKIKNDIPLDAWEQHYPFYSKYENIFRPIIDQTQNSTGLRVKGLIERAKSIKVGLLKKIIL